MKDKECKAYIYTEKCGSSDCKNCEYRFVKEENSDWITDRVPTKEECDGWLGTFQVTIPQSRKGEKIRKTVVMKYEYTIVRGKEVSRWLFNDRLAPWIPIAWKPLDKPYEGGE